MNDAIHRTRRLDARAFRVARGARDGRRGGHRAAPAAPRARRKRATLLACVGAGGDARAAGGHRLAALSTPAGVEPRGARFAAACSCASPPDRAPAHTDCLIGIRHGRRVATPVAREHRRGRVRSSLSALVAVWLAGVCLLLARLAGGLVARPAAAASRRARCRRRAGRTMSGRLARHLGLRRVVRVVDARLRGRPGRHRLAAAGRAAAGRRPGRPDARAGASDSGARARARPAARRRGQRRCRRSPRRCSSITPRCGGCRRASGPSASTAATTSRSRCSGDAYRLCVGARRARKLARHAAGAGAGRHRRAAAARASPACWRRRRCTRRAAASPSRWRWPSC